MDLAEFLLARIAEDEEDARLAASQRDPEWFLEEVPPLPWGVDAPDPVIISKGKPIIRVTDYNPCAAWHIARHDPARVLADCAAKRRIVKRHIPAQVGPRAGLDCFMDGDTYPCEDLRIIALIWAGHPDYRNEWLPDDPAVTPNVS